MTNEEHRQRHKELHSALDELFADYITHHAEQHSFTQMPVIQLIEWAHSQVTFPTEKESCDEEREHMEKMLKHLTEKDERAFDGEDAEEWQRRAEEQGETECR